MSTITKITLEKDQILFAKGERQQDLFYVQEGKLAICLNDKSKVTLIAYIEAGEFIGEMSFFDQQPRSAHVICVEPASLLKIPIEELDKQMPPWLILLTKSMTKKLRILNNLIEAKGIKKPNTKTIEPLSPQQQGHFYKLITSYQEQHGLTDEN